jgi:hypothetical protein
MPLLHVALQEGFRGEPVVVSVNDRELFRKDDVRTRTQIGRADAFELTVPTGAARIDVTARGTTTQIPVPLSTDLYVGVSVTPEGTIVHKQSTEPFGYL